MANGLKSYASRCCCRLAGRTPALAVEAFLEPLRRSLSCVTQSIIRVSGYHPTPDPLVLVLGDGGPVSLRGEQDTFLTVGQRYRLVEDVGPRGPWKVQTAGYLYAVDDGERREILAYHWHPEGPSTITTPHLHLGPGAEISRPDLPAAHLPSGRVSVEEVIRLLIVHLGVAPLRDDWRDIVDEAQAQHEAWRTWPAPKT